MRQVLAVVCVMLCVGVVVADKPVFNKVAPAVEPANKMNFQGEVVSFKDGKLTLKVGKEEKVLPISDKAECMNAEGTPLKDRAKELKPGTKVEVWLNEGGKEIKKVKILGNEKRGARVINPNVGVAVAQPVRVGAPAVAARPAPAIEPATKMNFKAEVVSLKDGKLTLKVEKEEKVFPISDKAECMSSEGTPLKDRAKELKAGTKVEVWLTEGGKEIKKVQIIK